MIKYFFILGRNPELSIAEIKAKFKVKDFIRKGNAILVDFEKPIQEKAIDELGGTISIGKVISEIDKKKLDKENLYLGTKNKLNYVIWNFSEKYDEISIYLKKRFREEKLKSTEKKLTGMMETQDGKMISISSSKNVEEQFFVFENYFGRIIQTSDYEAIEKRDMKKPVRREELSISPRIAKIMISLSGVDKNKKLIDPFCGIGVILQEALLQGINAIGIDKDEEAIEGAKKNLEWFGFSKKNYELIVADSSNVRISGADALVSEPDLGKILRRSPKKEEASKTLKNFEELVINTIENLRKNISGKIVFSSPFIQAIDSKKRIGCDFEKIASRTGLKLAEGFPISEFRKNQIVGREIVVLGRN